MQIARGTYPINMAFVPTHLAKFLLLWWLWWRRRWWWWCHSSRQLFATYYSYCIRFQSILVAKKIARKKEWLIELLGPVSIQRCGFIGIGNPIINMTCLYNGSPLHRKTFLCWDGSQLFVGWRIIYREPALTMRGAVMISVICYSA